MFKRVLIANRGEIAVRIIRACRELGVETVAVYSEADARALHVRLADQTVCIGPAAPRESYLDVEKVLAAARETGADALHPGYGFLSENADFAEAVAAAGLTWIGPPPDAIRAMGLKVEARALAEQAGVPVVPGFSPVGAAGGCPITEGQTPSDPTRDWEIAAAGIGYPVLVKASAGGGGKGMRVVDSAEGLESALAAARREAQSAFGDGRVYLEKYIASPRHIEIQVLADAHGNCVHLGERECSIQRRHQKVLEEAPSPFVTPGLRAEMGARAVALAQAVGYVGAGTVEFIAAPDGSYYFLEMNTRLQVEHPVTEFVYGLDLVQWQLRIAAGEAITSSSGGGFQPPTRVVGDTVSQDDVNRRPEAAATRQDVPPQPRGHAIEVRICAEDAGAGFLPQTGTVEVYREPQGPGVRVDTGLFAGWEIGADYDPMLGKLIVHGATRDEALARLRSALADYRILGVTTNLDFLRALAAHPALAEGATHTGFIAEHFAGWSAPAPELPMQLAAALAIATERSQVAKPAAGAAPGLAHPTSPWQSFGEWTNVRQGGPNG